MMQTFSGRRASQSEYELGALIELLRAQSVTRYLEVGARHGDTFYDVMRSLPRGSYGVALDLPGGNWGKDSSRTSLVKAVAALNRQGYRCSTLFGDSTTAATLAIVTKRGPY